MLIFQNINLNIYCLIVTSLDKDVTIEEAEDPYDFKIITKFDEVHNFKWNDLDKRYRII